MEWFVYMLCLLMGGGAGSVLTFMHLRKKAQPAPRSRPLENVRVALNITGSHGWNFTHEMEERIFNRGGRVVPLPSGWRPEKAASLQQANSSMTFPDLVIEGNASAKDAAVVGIRIYTGQGVHIGTLHEQNGGQGTWSFTPLYDTCIRVSEETIIKWQKQQPYDMLELELKEERILAESKEEQPAQLRQL